MTTNIELYETMKFSVKAPLLKSYQNLSVSSVFYYFRDGCENDLTLVVCIHYHFTDQVMINVLNMAISTVYLLI